MKSLRRLSTGAALVVLALTSVTACSGDDDASSSNALADANSDDVVTAEEALAYAKSLLDATSGVRLSLATEDTPDTNEYLKSAEGVITTAPAFEGKAAGKFMGFEASDIGVISVDGDFYIDVPLAGFQTFDPKDLCAPDPALLLDPADGVSGVLTSATDLEEGESRRGGADNSEILTSYSGTVPGSAITNILPCAPGDSFDATFTITAEGQLRAAELTGEFFGGGGEITYTIDISEYDVEQEISAP
ncbi:MAG: LppX_LprAFG lipoprotein [Nocardioides sp.]